MRFTIFISFFALTMLFVVVFSVVVRGMYERKTMDQKVNYTINQSKVLINQLIASSSFGTRLDSSVQSQIDQLASLLDGRIMVVDSNYRILSDTYQLTKESYLLSEDAIKAMNGTVQQNDNYKIKDNVIQCYIPIYNTITNKQNSKNNVEDSEEPLGLMVVTSSLKDTYVAMDYIHRQSKMLIMIIACFALLTAAFLTMKLTGQFREVTDSINAIADGRTNEELAVHGFTEMRELSSAFNNAIARLDKLEESRQEFVSNVSHELKTPITSMKVLADSLLTQEDIPAEVYREFMEDIVDEIDRENKIINDLLSLVKTDRKADNVLNVTTVNINDLLELLLKRLRPLAAKRNIEVVYESFREVNAEVDEVKLTLALSNLVENAIKYNKEDGWVRITLNADHKYFYVKIADSGVGIPEECQEHVFDRFYRVDKARSRDTGGTGLGLSITHSAVVMHHGTIKLHSKYGEGTTFTVRIPLTYSVSVHSVPKAVDAEKKSFHFRWFHKKEEDIKISTPTAVPIKNVSEVQGNLGEVISEATQNLEQKNAEKAKETETEPAPSGTVVVEPAPLEDAEPEMVVLHTEEMETPKVVVLQPEEILSEDTEKPVLDEKEDEKGDSQNED